MCQYITFYIEFYVSVTVQTLYNLVNKANLVHNLFLEYLFLVHLFINVYMFRATICPSSGETTVFMQHLVCRVE